MKLHIRKLNYFTNKFFMPLLSVAVAFSLLLVGLGSWNAWHISQEFKSNVIPEFHLQRLSDEITYLDEVLTMSARMAASTGDLQWERRYRSFEPKLDATIKQTIKMAPEAYTDYAIQTDLANLKLVDMENEAFQLIRQGDKDKALSILFSSAYEGQKQVYSEGMKQTNMALRKRVQFNLSIYDSMLSWSSLSSLVSLIILIIAWLIILVVVNQYFIRRRRLEKERLDNQLKLKKINEDLSQSENSLKQKAKDLELAMQELKLNQIQMVQSEKMSSLGLLVAGIAHEINNPITFIHGNIKYVEEYSNSLLGLVKIYQKHYPEPVTELQDAFNEFNIDFIQKDLPKTLKSINFGSERICQIVSLLRNFSRMDENDFKLVDIHEGINSTLLIVQYYIKSKDNMPEIQILKEYGDLPLVECYAGALNQVFLNILNNAIDALEEVDIHSDQTSCEFRDRQIRICTAIEADWVQIIIADNGVGMTEQVRQKIFDPFFTTKPVGKGTGLGMSISYKIIVEQHKGLLECHSTPNQGTKFLIRIPLR